MFSTGEVCIMSPAPVNDLDATMLAEIEAGSMLLDLDMMAQQKQSMPQAASPSLSGFGYPPSPDSGLSFYPEQQPFHHAQQMGSTIIQQGHFSDIDENDMVRLIMREMIPVILEDCQKLNLHPNLYTWSPEDVRNWIACVIQRMELSDIDSMNFNFTGAVLAHLSDADFRMLAPKCGDILFSIVYILKSSLPPEQFHQPQVVPQQPMAMHPPPHHLPEMQTGVPTVYHTQPRYQPPMASPSRHDEHYDSSSGSPSDDECSVHSPAAAPTGPNTSMTPNHTGGIQLWQFLKELLLQPNSYSYCIRWLNRDEGIFKIEDSVEVARLWGLRKNRPAMNYDKLSRSIRQYYRKGIMKKTEVSQRLVYQFVHVF